MNVQSDGNILVNGLFTEYQDTPIKSFVRLYGEGVASQASSSPPTLGEEGYVRYNKDIKAFQAYNGTSWQLFERITPPKELANEDTVNINFSETNLYIQELQSNITYTGSSYLPGSTVTIMIRTTSSRNLSFPSGWVFVGGAKPSSIAANKTALLTITSFGNTERNCVAEYKVQS